MDTGFPCIPAINSSTPLSDQDKKFSSQYQYNIKQTSDENNEKYQILQTNITRTAWETARRITKETLGITRLKKLRKDGGRLFEMGAFLTLWPKEWTPSRGRGLIMTWALIRGRRA